MDEPGERSGRLEQGATPVVPAMTGVVIKVGDGAGASAVDHFSSLMGEPYEARAQVKAVNHISGRVLILTPRGYTVADILEGELSAGDAVEGMVDSYGNCLLRNLTSEQPARVYVEVVQAPSEIAQRLLDAPARP